jgi:transposase-like protein
VEDVVISLWAKGLTTGEIQADMAEVYDSDISRQTISPITDFASSAGTSSAKTLLPRVDRATYR